MAKFPSTSIATGGISANDQFALGSIKHFTLADANTDASTATYLEGAVNLISSVATIVQIGTAAAGGWRFAVENTGVTAAQLQALLRGTHLDGTTFTAFDANVTVADFAY